MFYNTTSGLQLNDSAEKIASEIKVIHYANH